MTRSHCHIISPVRERPRNTRIDIASQASCAIGRMSESNLINDNACT